MSNKLRSEITVRKIDNLNKENFFNKAMSVYPNATNHFYYYAEKYKKEVFIAPSFNSPQEKGDVIGYGGIGGHSELDFFDLPLEMQFGIVLNFFGTAGWPSCDVPINMGIAIARDHWIDFICDLFEGYENTYPAGK